MDGNLWNRSRKLRRIEPGTETQEAQNYTRSTKDYVCAPYVFLCFLCFVPDFAIGLTALAAFVVVRESAVLSVPT